MKCPKCDGKMEKNNFTDLPWWIDEAWDCVKCSCRIFVSAHR